MSAVYGVATPNYSLGNANTWASRAAAHGVRVDAAPSVGSVAQWPGGSSGHVAVVEEVGANYIVVSEDNWGGDFHWVKLTPGGYYPTNFIHFAGASTAAGEIAFQANTGNLWTVGPGGVGDTHLGMRSGTSPSIQG
jgi:surface antigen